MRHYIYVEEGILFLSILSSLAMMLHTKNNFDKYPKAIRKVQSKSKILFEETAWADYTFWVRNNTILSGLSYLTVVIALSNYIFSIIFVRQYLLYNTTLE